MFAAFIRALAFALALFPALIFAQSPISAFPPGTFSNKAALDPASGAYQGPGDMVSGAIVWGSCARVYNAAAASTSTSLCDLVAVTGGAAVCTLRGTASGFVDLAASYCAGTTPSAACAAASGGSCKVSKVYDQTGTGNHFTQATLGNMPALTFSALNGLPGLTFTSAASSQINTPAMTQAQPYSMSGVYKRTSGNTNQTAVLAINGTNTGFGPFSSVNSVYLAATTNQSVTDATHAADNAFIALQAVFLAAGAASVLDPNGTPTTGLNPAAGGLSASVIRMGRSSAGGSLDGVIMEAGIWPSAFNATQYGNLNTNQHSAANGYNF